MKAITIHQPWAWLVATGRATMNARHWSTDYRGKLAIHAATSVDLDVVAALKDCGVPVPADLPTKAFVAVVDLVDCRPALDCYNEARATTAAELDEEAVRRVYGRTAPWTGQMFPNIWSLVFANLNVIAPVPARGDKLLWTPTDAQISDLRAAWARARKQGSSSTSGETSPTR